MHRHATRQTDPHRTTACSLVSPERPTTTTATTALNRNEEIQAIRSLPVQSLEDRVLRAKLEFKTISEFTAACRTIAVAIADGLISPISFADPTSSGGIYLYNGIFLSKAEDTKDSFQICRGDEAYRKSTNREVQNQRLIRSLEVEGLSLTLITSVDFKGQRYVGQSVVPGVFTQGENAARLVYGILEKDKMLTVSSGWVGSWMMGRAIN